MEISYNLNLPLVHGEKYYFLKNDQHDFPEIIAKFQNFIDAYYQAIFLGYVDRIMDENKVDKTATLIVISHHLNYKDFSWHDKCLYVVLWDDMAWGKLEIVNLMIKSNHVNLQFNINNFRRLIELIRPKTKNGQVELGPFVIRRLVPYQGILNKFPMIFKKEANLHDGYYYGHPTGYARDLVLYDIKFTRKFSKVIRSLSDQKSINLFKLVVYGKADAIWEHFFNTIKKPPQYLDYISLNKDSVVINCGVERGAELPVFISMGCYKIYNIDPFGNKQLGEYAKTWVETALGKNIFIEKWLYNRPSDQTDRPIASLKDIISDQEISKIDLIKVDIEGSERDMVEDLIEIMNEYRTQVAVSIYHTQHDDKTKSPLSDLVEIPLKIMNKVRDYDFYINFYSFERWEIILYCIPKKQRDYLPIG